MNTTDKMNTIDEMRTMSEDELADVAGGFQVYEGGGAGPLLHPKINLGNLHPIFFPFPFF